jgi:hypothetical protein
MAKAIPTTLPTSTCPATAPLTRAATAPIPHPSADLENDFWEVMMVNVAPRRQPKLLDSTSVGSILRVRTSVAGLRLLRRSGLEVTGRHGADTRSRTAQCRLKFRAPPPHFSLVPICVPDCVVPILALVPP